MTEDRNRPGVVLRFRNGEVVRGVLAQPFEPGGSTVEAVTEGGVRTTVPLEELKAVFFLKDPRQRRIEVEFSTEAEEAKPAGAPARVVFQDGEIIHGRVDTYAIADGGFFLYPTSKDSNNEKVFVIAAALTSLAIEG